MNSRPLPLLCAAAFGFALALGGISLWAPRPAKAQFGAPAVNPYQPATGTAQVPSQPLEIRPMDATHFVVATREPRLVLRNTGNGAALNMLVTVISYYTVREDRLVALEHVDLPAGYRLAKVEE